LQIYGEGNYPKTTLKRVKVLAITKQTTKLTKRIALALEQLVKSGANPDNIVVIGYCFGGTAFLKQLEVTRQVSFHGGLGKDKSRPNDNHC
jgi:dienelactone hydrolase